MVCNVGGIERPIRIVVGLILLAIGALGGLSIAWTIGLLIVGGIGAATGFLGYCPAYTLFGVSTCPTHSTGKA
jgi:hypothetical protein